MSISKRTTTPWTLPSNILITVGPEVVYVRAKMLEGAREEEAIFTFAKNLADKVLR